MLVRVGMVVGVCWCVLVCVGMVVGWCVLVCVVMVVLIGAGGVCWCVLVFVCECFAGVRMVARVRMMCTFVC